MYGEERQMLEKILTAAEDNNRMLHRLQRARRWSSFFSAIKWLIVIASSLGAYYYLQPLLDEWPAIWSKFQAAMQSLDVLNQLPK